MACYTMCMSQKISSNPNGNIKAAEFSQSDYAHVAMFEVQQGVDAAALLAHVPVTILTQTEKAGRNIVIAQVNKTEGAVLQALEGKGEMLVDAPEEKKGFDPMFARGAASIVGQGLQIASGLTVFDEEKYRHNKDHPNDQKSALGMDVLGFAGLNLAANFSNMIFGSQHKTDDNHTRMLKERFNDNIANYAENADALPDPNARAMDSRPPEKLSFAQKAYKFGQEQSITFGEVGLRTLGTMALIFPVNNLAPAFQKLKNEGVGAAFQEALNTDENGHLNKTGMSGAGMLLGKVTSMLAKEKDPYNPKDANWLDTFREDYAFKTSTVIETGATAYMMVDRLKNKKSLLGVDKEELDKSINDGTFNVDNLNPDYLGGLGNLVFLGGYGMRFGASVGSMDADKEELYAHAADALMALNPADIPEALAGAAISLKEHFKEDSTMTVTDVYTGIVKELEQQHNITISDLVKQQLSENNIVSAKGLRADEMDMDVTPPRQKVSDAEYQQPLQEAQLAATR